MSDNNERKEMLDPLFKCLESTQVTAFEAKEILTDVGYNVDKELTEFKARLNRKIRSYTWKDDADKKIVQFSSRRPSRDWSTVSEEKLNEAIRQQDADYLIAARNLEYLTRADKIAILQDLELLDEQSKKSDS